MLDYPNITYEYRIYFYYSIDIYDVLFCGFSEIRNHFDFHINTDFTKSVDNCDYIKYSNKYIQNETNKKVYNEFNDNFRISLYNKDIEKEIFYRNVLNASKIRLSGETYMINETNKDIF